MSFLCVPAGRLFKPLTSPELNSYYGTPNSGSLRGRIRNLTNRSDQQRPGPPPDQLDYQIMNGKMSREIKINTLIIDHFMSGFL